MDEAYGLFLSNGYDEGDMDGLMSTLGMDFLPLAGFEEVVGCVMRGPCSCE